MAIFEVFYEPGKLFASLPNRRGLWALPLILGLLFTLGATYAVIHRIGIETIVRQQVENRSNLTPDQMQQAINRANSPAIGYLIYGVAGLAALVLPLIVSGALAIFALMAPQQPKFGTMFSMVTLAYFPYTVVVTVMSLLVLYLVADPTALDYQNLLSTNVAAFMNKETTGKGMYAFMTSMDLISFVEIGFLRYGFSKITRSSFFYGLFSVGSLWFLYVLIRAALASLQ